MLEEPQFDSQCRHLFYFILAKLQGSGVALSQNIQPETIYRLFDVDTQFQTL